MIGMSLQTVAVLATAIIVASIITYVIIGRRRFRL